MKKLALLSIALLSTLQAKPIKVPTELYAGLGDKRELPGHYPFISHLTFRSICDISIENTTEWFDPDEVKRGDTIYLNIWYLGWFLKEAHDRIKHPYILVTGDVGGWLPPHELKRLLYDPKLAAWFCRNMLFSYHPKLIQIPMGQDYTLFSNGPDVTKPIQQAIANKAVPKKHLLYMNHLPRQHGDRQLIVKIFENEPYCLTRNRSDQEYRYLHITDFYQEMLTCNFVLSPLGLETDCVRTWEAIVVGCIPIVEHSFLDPLFDRLPVLMVHDWKEINAGFLEKKYGELKDRKTDEAFFDYWWNRVKEAQTKVRNGENRFSQLEATQFSVQDLENLCSILEKDRRHSLFYMGFLSTARPLQLANAITTRIYLYDPWLDKGTFSTFEKYLVDQSLLENDQKISLFEKEREFFNRLSNKKESSLFLDLTYYRSSIFIDFSEFRHKLKRDLIELYLRIPSNTLVCGNMFQNDYVKECLEMFANENKIEIQNRGSFWFFTKSI